MADVFTCFVYDFALLCAWIREIYRKFSSLKKVILNNLYHFDINRLVFKKIWCQKYTTVALGSFKSYEISIGYELRASQSEFEQVEGLWTQLLHVWDNFIYLHPND